MSSITMALADTARHPNVAHLTEIDGAALIAAPIAPASFVLMCADGATLAIRYMDAGDIMAGLRGGMFDADMIDLKARSEWAYLLIGGQVTPARDGKIEGTGWRWDAYQGALLSVQEAGIGVVTLAGRDDVPAALARLARRDRAPRRVRPVRPVLFVDPATDLLMALPGVGEAMADRLIAHCGSAAWALAALTSDVMDAPGIGPKTRESARKALGLAPDIALIPTQEKSMPLHEQAYLLQIGSIPRR